MALIKKILDKYPSIEKDCYISETSVIIGDVTIGNQSSVWFNAVIRGDVNFIKIGNRVNIQDNAVIHCTYMKYPTFIGNNVSIGHNAVIHGCTIHDNVLIGMGAIIMDNVTVESDAIIAAGAVVTQGKLVAKGEIWGGVPAKKIGITSEEIKKDKIHQTASNYIKYSKWYTNSEDDDDNGI
ncbi:MAG: gamma carbonic anhydrase family protein [Apibacter sp.]|nr:gamma carbonic anhydrase family protein [Apibacter sp.]